MTWNDTFVMVLMNLKIVDFRLSHGSGTVTYLLQGFGLGLDDWLAATKVTCSPVREARVV